MQRRRYTVDLPTYMAECEANYLRLGKLLPAGEDQAVYNVHISGERQVRISFRVAGRCKYTTMMVVELEWLDARIPDSHFELRIYHDASMAEVVACQKQRGIRPVYGYPNEKMFQQDEKFQQHRFLSECLAVCLGNGSCVVEYPMA